jgi:hypothetical protein
VSRKVDLRPSVVAVAIGPYGTLSREVQEKAAAGLTLASKGLHGQS